MPLSLAFSLSSLSSLAVACATTSPSGDAASAGTASEVADASPATAEAPSATGSAGTPAPSSAPPVSEPGSEPGSVPGSVPPSGASERTADGIDDENWLPRPGTPGHTAFLDATEALRRDPLSAPARFAAAAAATPGFYAAWYNAGAAAEGVGDVAKAEAHYREALRLRPDHGPSLVNLSMLLSAKGRDDDAKRLIDDALRAAPQKAGPHVAAALRALRTRDLVDAEREAREAIKVDERSVPAMLVMAQVFRGQGRLDTARFAVENALALEPGNALLHLERGHVLLAQSDRTEALVAFERSARLRPTLAEALEPYGRLLLERGFAVEARATFEMLVRQQPKSGLAQLYLGNALRATKSYPAAEAAYNKALELDPDLDEVHFNMALLSIDNGVGDADELVRLQKGLEGLKRYQSRAQPDAATKARLAEYIESTEKRVGREQKRRERDRKRQADEATGAKAPDAPVPAPETGSTDDK